VEIHPIGLVACGTTVWRFRGQLRVTAVVKAAFSFVQGDAMELEDPLDVLVDDVPYGGDPWSLEGLGPAWSTPPDPARSAWGAGDLAPFRMRADVTLVGRAFFPSGRGTVRLAVFGEHLLLDKKIRVVRQADEALPVPLIYERALGGRGSAENPAGTGLDPGSPLPDLTDPRDPRRAVGFAPVPRWWPARAGLLGALDPAALTAPIIEMPSDFDWGYFQAAPEGQTLDFFQGDEWVRLEGMHDEHAVLQSRLPGAMAAGRAYGLHGADAPPVPIVFRADNLHIDADRLRCSVTYRASFHVTDEAALAQLVLLAGVELPDHPIRWPESVRLASPVVEVVPPPEEDPEHAPTQELIREPRRQATVLMEWGEAGAPPARAPQPTLVMDADAAALPLPRARMSTVMMDWGETGVPAPLPPQQQRQPTVLLEWPAGAAPAGAAPAPVQEARGPMPTVLLDWGADAPPEAAPPAADPPSPLEGTMAWIDDDAIEVIIDDDDHPLMGTLALVDDAGAARSVLAPFQLPAPGAARGAPAREIAGAPWASTPAAAVPRPLDERTRSLVIPVSASIRDDLLDEAPARPQVIAAPAVVAAPARAIPLPRVRASIRERFAVPAK
jgi:hypothetical protein